MATKRSSTLDAIKLAAKPSKPTKATKATPRAQQGETMTTAIHIRRDHWELLHDVASARARVDRSRLSVSAVIGTMVERMRKDLEKEAGR